MVLVTLKQILGKANKNNYAVGAFNVNNMEFIQAVVNAAELEKSPAIIQTSEGAIKYAGLANLIAMVRLAAKRTKAPIALHLDHGKDMNMIKNCIKYGYTSVMIDGSKYPFKKNVAVTKKVVAMAHKKGVSVEAEIGTIGGVEDNVKSKNIILSDVDDCYSFAKLTKIDALAIAIGTSHGAYKFKGRSKLDFKRLREIKSKLNVPLVLHGSSSIYANIVKKAEKYGAKLGNAHGVMDSDVRKAVKYGINKVNIDTDLRLMFDASVREVIAKNPKVFDPRKILGPARDAITEIVRHKMKILGSSGKA